MYVIWHAHPVWLEVVKRRFFVIDSWVLFFFTTVCKKSKKYKYISLNFITRCFITDSALNDNSWDRSMTFIHTSAVELTFKSIKWNSIFYPYRSSKHRKQRIWNIKNIRELWINLSIFCESHEPISSSNI